MEFQNRPKPNDNGPTDNKRKEKYIKISGQTASDQLPAMQLDAAAPQITAIHFRPANVRRQLTALNPHKATGPDGISARVLKECHRELAEPAARLFSCCFRAGVQPASWKLAHVSFIHKKSSKSIVSNYRPVSLLSILSKVMESIANSQLVNFLERHRLLNTRQYGFRRGTGAADLLTVLQYEWANVMAEGGATQAVAVDIAGGF